MLNIIFWYIWIWVSWSQLCSYWDAQLDDKLMCQVVWHRWTTSKEVVIIGRWDWRLALAALSQNGWKETKTEIQIGGCVSQCIHIGGCRGTPSICKYLNLWPVMKSLNGYHDVPWQIITFDMIWGCLYIYISYIYIYLEPRTTLLFWGYSKKWHSLIREPFFNKCTFFWVLPIIRDEGSFEVQA